MGRYTARVTWISQRNYSGAACVVAWHSYDWETGIFLKAPNITNLALTNTEVPENQTNMSVKDRRSGMERVLEYYTQVKVVTLKKFYSSKSEST